MIPRWMLLVLGLLPLYALADCDNTSARARAEGRAVIVVFNTLPARIRVGELFSLHATLCANAGASPVRAFKVDASMPDHRHGMNYKPSVVRQTEHDYTASGLMFHMPGRWQYVFEVDTADGRERILFDYLLD